VAVLASNAIAMMFFLPACLLWALVIHDAAVQGSAPTCQPADARCFHGDR